ncbi:MAG: desulfoferrodoxin [Clostridiales bacterium]|nr:desulfoferrodoxin [Clostridiales bacterium]
MKFYRCEKCGNIVEMLYDGGGQLVCCGEPMIELTANTVDAATEKHVPFVQVDGNKINVQVGEVVHPMLEAHYIMWIILETDKRIVRVNLKPEQAPNAVFTLEEGEKALGVYEYCNLHGLWKKEL